MRLLYKYIFSFQKVVYMKMCIEMVTYIEVKWREKEKKEIVFRVLRTVFFRVGTVLTSFFQLHHHVTSAILQNLLVVFSFCSITFLRLHTYAAVYVCAFNVAYIITTNGATVTVLIFEKLLRILIVAVLYPSGIYINANNIVLQKK